MVFVVVALCVLFLLLFWLFLIAPHTRKEAIKPFLRSYAHRGLWDTEIPENSLAAFERAAEKGFAIELDVQLSADGKVFVFHDYSLKRMCGIDRKLSELTESELSATMLSGGTEPIPTLAEVLKVVDGRVPLLIELKGESPDTSLCPPVAELLDKYHGAFCVESFNPFLLRWFRKHRPEVVRGLLVTDLIKEKRSGSKVVNYLLSAECFNVLCRPAFIAWNHRFQKSLARGVVLRCFGAASFVYTVHDEQEYHNRIKKGENPIFDGFVPEQKAP